MEKNKEHAHVHTHSFYWSQDSGGRPTSFPPEESSLPTSYIGLNGFNEDPSRRSLRCVNDCVAEEGYSTISHNALVILGVGTV